MTTTTCTCFRGERGEKSFGHLWSCPQYTPPSPRFSDTETNLRWRTNLSPRDFELVLAAERRATVERIRQLAVDQITVADHRFKVAPLHEFLAILDEEAAR